MKKEKGLLFLGNKKYGDTSIFDVEKVGTKYGKVVLKWSKLQSTWTKPGQVSSEIVNHGDGFIFRSYGIDGTVRHTVNLDYGDAQELRALLKFMDDSKETFKYVEIK